MQYRKGRKCPYVVQVVNCDGVTETHSFANRDDALECEALLKRTRRRVRAGLEKPQTKTLFLDFAKDFMKTRVQKLPESTWSSDESKLRRIWLPKFGGRLLTSVTTTEVQTELDRLRYDGVKNKKDKLVRISQATSNRHRALLHTFFQAAISQDLLKLNPISRIPVLSEKVKSRPVVVWTTDEEGEAYLKAASEMGDTHFIASMVLIWLGLRIGELIPLKWGDSHFVSKFVAISRIFDITTGQIFDRTKGQGEGGTRVIPLFQVLANALLVWRAKAKHNRDSDFVFAKEDGSHYAYSFFYKSHIEICERAKVKRTTVHAIRHYFASKVLKAGFSTKDLQEMLGHEEAKTTEGYGEIDLGHLLERAAKLGFGLEPSAQPELNERQS